MKSSNSEHAMRINTALELIKGNTPVAQAANLLIEQYGISKRQAYRYISAANIVGEQVPVPDQKIAFTVKLSKALIQKIRKYAKYTGKTLSEIVTQSLEAFFQNGQGRG